MPLTSDSCGESLKLRADPLALSVHQDHLGGQGTARQLITLPLQLGRVCKAVTALIPDGRGAPW
jgi:hypothetical protein